MTSDDSTSTGEANAQGIHSEPSPFEPSFQPGTVPAITVPNLAEDAIGVSAEVLAEAAIPTLTEQVLPDPELPALIEEVSEQGGVVSEEIEEAPQEPEIEADTWHELMQVRMTKLSGEIQTLNDRLDRLEQRAKTKA